MVAIGPEQSRLIACVVAEQPGAGLSDILAERLARAVPQFMVLQRIMMMPGLPGWLTN